MSTIVYETWDEFAAPGRPSGWNYDTVGWFTSATRSLSGANSLSWTSGGIGSGWCTWNALDGAGGQVSASSYFYFTGSFEHRWGLGLRFSALMPGGTGYVAWCRWYPGDTIGLNVQLSRYSSGSETSVVTVGGVSAVATWYYLYYGIQGSTHTIQCQRQSDGYWLNASGSFVASATTAITRTDATYSGSGYGGLAVDQNSPSMGFWSDNYTLSSFDTLLTPDRSRLPVSRPANSRYWV